MLDNIKIATWNLLYFDWDIQNRLDEAAAHLLEADVVCLQEVRGSNVIHAGEALAHKLGMSVASNVKYMQSENKAPNFDKDVDVYSCILSRFPALESGRIEYAEGKNRAAATVLLETPKSLLLVLSAHLDWGGENESVRLAQANSLNEAVSIYKERIENVYEKDAIIVLAGDFNALPEAQSIRYLKGLAVENSLNPAFWLDAWEVADEKNDEIGATSSPRGNHLAHRVAETFCLKPELVPDRRIDYIFVNGWAYGSAGHVFSCDVIGKDKIVGETLASDHYGLLATIWNP
jgi:endonuclease/exonuclease/phosphatase family metal-dependent hydrolase